MVHLLLWYYVLNKIPVNQNISFLIKYKQPKTKLFQTSIFDLKSLLNCIHLTLKLILNTKIYKTVFTVFKSGIADDPKARYKLINQSEVLI